MRRRQPLDPAASLALSAAYVDEHAAGVFLSLSVKTLQNWRIAGRGPRYPKFGDAVRYSINDLQRWADAQVVSQREAAKADAAARHD
jgi:hypothetical protein